MNNLQRTPQQEPDVSIYDPECAVNSPELIRSCVDSLDTCTEFCERLANGFFTLIPYYYCLLYTSPSPRDLSTSRMPSSA